MRLARSQATDAYDPEAERRSRLCKVVTQKLDVAQGGESETGSLGTDRTRTPIHMLYVSFSSLCYCTSSCVGGCLVVQDNACFVWPVGRVVSFRDAEGRPFETQMLHVFMCRVRAKRSALWSLPNRW
jgi:hypothetical protein